MIVEIVEIDILEGHAADFEAAVAKAAPLFQNSRGCRSFALNRSIEKPQLYRLNVGWDTVEDHMVHFRESEAFLGWRALVGPHFANPPRVEHVNSVFIGF